MARDDASIQPMRAEWSAVRPSVDPWVSIGPDGTAYIVGLALSDPFAGPSAIAVVSSRNGGRAWGNVRVIQADADGITSGNDKPSVTADPTRAGTAYVVWDRCDNCRKPVLTTAFPRCSRRLSTLGLTWSRPKSIAVTGPDQQSIGNAIVVDSKTHTLYNFYNFYHCTTCVSVPRIEFVQSTDGGATWQRPARCHRVSFRGCDGSEHEGQASHRGLHS